VNRLPNPDGTGSNGTDSRAAASATALTVASPPIAIRVEKAAGHDRVHGTSSPSVRKACTRAP